MKAGDRETIEGRRGPVTANRFPSGAIHYDVRGGAYIATKVRYGNKVWRPHSQTIPRHYDKSVCSVM